MIAFSSQDLEFSDAYVEGDDGARWRSASGHSPSTGARSSGSSVIEVPSGCRLPRHTDSAEETVVILAGAAEVLVGDERASLPAGGLAVIPVGAPHELRNVGEESLRFVALYASADVVTRYDDVVQPDGSRERHTVSWLAGARRRTRFATTPRAGPSRGRRR
jgi:quercetin dioxygenase-like cupin family protein